MLSVAVLALVLSASAQAAFPGQNGKLALVAPCNTFTVNPDGTAETQVTFEPCGTNPPPRSAVWSPDGTKIAYTKQFDLFVVDADGSGETNLTAGMADAVQWPDWSPDGSRIVFTRSVQTPEGARLRLWISNADGSNPVPLDTGLCHSYFPEWHPEGSRIAFIGATTSGPNGCENYGKWTINLDGTGLAPLAAEDITDWSPDGSKVAFGTNGIYTQVADGAAPPEKVPNTDGGSGPRWSPDGRKIAFLLLQSNGTRRLNVIDLDGSGLTEVSTRPAAFGSWQPIPVNTYVRPKGASPMRVSLVPAYQPCTSPNRTHGPPLAFGSCNPPGREPGQLTVGTFDANSQPAKSVSYIRINPIRGNPSTPADEADVRMRGTINDVRLASDLSDYTGNVQARLTIRITDKDNTPHPGGPGPATVQDFTQSQPLLCAATADTTVGAICDFDTTVEALVPGAVKEQQRTIWQLDAVRVHDGAGNLFLTQGVFVP